VAEGAHGSDIINANAFSASITKDKKLNK